MAKSKAPTENKASPLEAIAGKLAALAEEAKELGEERVAKSIGYSVKSARFADKQRSLRIRRVGGMVERMQAQGLTADQIVARLTGGKE
jgi:hypothetical protein